MLDATTNYECYKGLYSSHVDQNYFEIAYSLNRLFGCEGIYRDLFLYNFADNHDVNRVASSLTNPAHLYTLYGLLFTMPGIPSIYYGSEWGIDGRRTRSSDQALRPAIDLHANHFPHPQLCDAIRHFANIRHTSPALKYGSYQQQYLTHEQFSFERATEDQLMIVLLNASHEEVSIPLKQPDYTRFQDVLNHQSFETRDGQISINVPSNWLRILEAK
jgi:glycosidase